MTDISVKVHSGLDGLYAIKTEWQQLCNTLKNEAFYHRWEWYESYLTCLDSDPSATNFFLIYQKNELTAILPIKHVKVVKRSIPLTVQQIPAHSHLNLADFIIADDAILNPVEVVCSFLREHANRKKFDYDILRLTNIPANSKIITSLKKTPPKRLLFYAPRQSAYFECLNQEALQQNLSGHLRRNLKRLKRKAEQNATIECDFICDSEGLEAAFGEFLRLEGCGWKGETGTGTAINGDEQLTGFYKSLIDNFSKNGDCQINLLRLNGQAVAAQFCLLCNGKVFLLKIGFDESYKDVGPGAILLLEFLDRCANDPAINMVSLTTNPGWAVRWHPKVMDVYDVLIFNKGLRGCLGYLFKKNKILRQNRPNNEDRTP